MTNKIIAIGVVILLIIGVVVYVNIHTSGTKKSGALPITATTYTDLNVTGSYYANGTAIINSLGNIITLGTSVFNDVIFGAAGFSTTYSTANGTSQNITLAQFCSGTALLVPNTSTTTLTLTYPAATTTFAGCGGVAGSWSNEIFDNESGSAITFATTTGGSGVTFFVASTTAAAVGVPAWPPRLLASTSMIITGQYVDSSHLNLYITQYQRQ